jgi:putative acetyltransferase
MMYSSGPMFVAALVSGLIGSHRSARRRRALPDHQAKGIGSALMNALLCAADAQDVSLVVLLGSPQYYGRFGFRPAVELGVMPPELKWGSAFQARPLRAYTPSVAGPFEYAPAFSS